MNVSPGKRRLCEVACLVCELGDRKLETLTFYATEATPNGTLSHNRLLESQEFGSSKLSFLALEW